jgi:cytochrome c peroxidase
MSINQLFARFGVILVAGVLLVTSVLNPVLAAPNVYEFTDADVEFLMNFSIKNLPPLPPAPSNRVADNVAAAKMGQAIFSDKRFSANGAVSCAQCHQPEKYFTDGLPQAEGLGKTKRNAPTLLGAAYGPWKNWDGGKDSLWSQALGPIEHEKEQALSRLDVAKQIIRFYRTEYEAVFGKIPKAAAILNFETPASSIGSQKAIANWKKLSSTHQSLVNRIFSNVGKTMMAYERRLPLPASRFDDFLQALQTQPKNNIALKKIFSTSQVRGMRLYMGQARCASCHNGPLLSNFEFHNVGAKEPNTKQVDLGRYNGIQHLQGDEFTCLSQWSDAKPDQCDEMNFLKKNGPELVGAFKTPSLRNVAKTAPYMQSGQFATLVEVVAHYNKPAPPFYDRKQHPSRPHFDIVPLNLTEQQQEDLVAFLRTLTSQVPSDDPWWVM